MGFSSGFSRRTMLRISATVLAAGLLVLGSLHSLEAVSPARALDGELKKKKKNQQTEFDADRIKVQVLILRACSERW